MKETHTRFPRKALWRQVDRIIRLAERNDPGPIRPDQERQLPYQALRRQLVRHEDMYQVKQAALALRDTLAWIQ